MHKIAKALDSVSGGRVTPNMVTIVGLVAHIFIAVLIALGALQLERDYWLSAGAFLIIFGLFDTLDGELARLQKRSSPAGMFLDSVTDRMKEVILYASIGYALLELSRPIKSCGRNIIACFNTFGISEGTVMIVIVLAVGGSLLVSYVNAWGEAVLSRSEASQKTMNKTFRGGLASFEIRISLIILGLLTTYLFTAVVVIGILVAVTLTSRMYRVFKELRRVQS